MTLPPMADLQAGGELLLEDLALARRDHLSWAGTWARVAMDSLF